MIFFETERLLLRNLYESDLDVILDYRSNEECRRYQRWDALTRQEILAFLRTFASDVFLSDREEQHFAVCLKGSSEPVGEMACFYSPGDCITLGITISHHHQRKGYAFEIMTEAVGRLRTAHPGLDIVGLIEKGNQKSIGLFKKLGFELECYAESLSSYVYVLYAR